MKPKKRVGLVVNPIAGMGGRVGLKGTDGGEMLKIARELGAEPRAGERAAAALKILAEVKDHLILFTYPGEMGETVARDAGFSPVILGKIIPGETTAADTRNAAKDFLRYDVDLILFTGGDGTARDIVASVGDSVTALGIPAGVKIHSAAFATHPESAGKLALDYLAGTTSHVNEAEVMDLNEDLYRQGILETRVYGYLKIPFRRKFVQNRKSASPRSDEYYQDAIAADVIKEMDDECVYIIGPGTTTRAIMRRLNLEYTLIGVDVIHKKRLIGKDVNETMLMNLIREKPVKLIVTPIGGQGFLFGRGNQQVSPSILKYIGKVNIVIIATPQKINSLRGSPLLVDTGDRDIDLWLQGYYRIITGYREAVIYKVSC